MVKAVMQKGEPMDECSSGNILLGVGYLLDLGNKEVKMNERIIYTGYNSQNV